MHVVTARVMTTRYKYGTTALAPSDVIIIVLQFITLEYSLLVVVLVASRPCPPSHLQPDEQTVYAAQYSTVQYSTVQYCSRVQLVACSTTIIVVAKSQLPCL